MSENEELKDILEAINHGTCMDDKDREIIKEAAERMAARIKELEQYEAMYKGLCK